MREGMQRAAAKTEKSAIAAGAANVESAIAGLKEKGMSVTLLTDAQEAVWAKAY